MGLLYRADIFLGIQNRSRDSTSSAGIEDSDLPTTPERDSSHTGPTNTIRDSSFDSTSRDKYSHEDVSVRHTHSVIWSPGNEVILQ